jgi:hypothetical protein
VATLVVVSAGHQSSTSQTSTSASSSRAGLQPAPTKAPKKPTSKPAGKTPHKAPSKTATKPANADLMRAVISFEESLRSLYYFDTAASHRARVSILATDAYLAKLDFALCGCPADQARIKGHITITAKLLPENITIDEDHGVYFVTALVDMVQTDPHGKVLEQYQLPLHKTTWRKSSVWWEVIDGDSDTG